MTSPVVWLEGLLRSGRWDPLSTTPTGSFRLRPSAPTPSVGSDVYFCIPPNPKLLTYWDTVEDRLFKIRNSLNIEGVFRTLALYEPPIDPALLVRASAMGVDLGTVLSELSTPLPNHRFSVMVQRAQALVGSVKALGGSLLSAMEKRDAEALALLRAGHEVALAKTVRQSKEFAIDEAREAVAATRASRKTVEARRDYYRKLIEKGWLGEENTAALLQADSALHETNAGILNAIGGILGAFPDLTAGVAAGSTFGGDSFSRLMGGLASAESAVASFERGAAGYLSTVAGYKRREQEWKNQLKLAEKELKQIDKQVAAGDIRLAIAKHDLQVHDQQASQSEDVKSWMESKFTNQELYDWMVTQVSATYYQSYQLAFQVAKRAERCYQHELGRDDTFINATYWNNSRKGLLAGEQLGFDLERMDTAYTEYDAREVELSKNISLAQLDPLALHALRELGECYFSIPEVWFDADCTGHYYRRIQSVALSIACVAGSQGNVNAQLTLHRHGLRQDATTATTTDIILDAGDYSSIVTSLASNDAGVFSADLRDPRYLPFERKGAVSQWHLRLMAQKWKQLDWASITDVTIHMRYTARDGGLTFRSARDAVLVTGLASIGVGYLDDTFSPPTTTGEAVAFSAKRDAPDAFYDAQSGASTTFDLDIDSSMLPDVTSRIYARVLVIAVGSSAITSACTVTNGSPAGSGTTSNSAYYLFALSTSISASAPATLPVGFTFGSGYSFESLSDIIVILLP